MREFTYKELRKLKPYKKPYFGYKRGFYKAPEDMIVYKSIREYSWDYDKTIVYIVQMVIPKGTRFFWDGNSYRGKIRAEKAFVLQIMPKSREKFTENWLEDNNPSICLLIIYLVILTK